MIPNAELTNRIAQWRQKVQDKTITLDEMKEAIVFMRGGRLAATHAASESKAKSRVKPEARNTDDLLRELGI